MSHRVSGMRFPSREAGRTTIAEPELAPDGVVRGSPVVTHLARCVMDESCVEQLRNVGGGAE